ncbi:MAG TPA: histidine kinase [Puia sp.]|nr:histidine kinase [Puia sp.]
MKKCIFLFALLIVTEKSLLAQIQWASDSISTDKIEWNNYSTTFLGDVNNNIPFIITAIPNNGLAANIDETNTPVDISFNGSLFRFRSHMSEKSIFLDTYDSSEVYFLTPGIYAQNADKYEFQVSLNAKKVITPWTQVSRFSNFQLNTFKKGYGFLGGYKTSWGNFIAVELRKKGSDTAFTAAFVSWKEMKPKITGLFTTKDFNNLFKIMTRPWDKTIHSTTVPLNPVFEPTENNIILTMKGEVYIKNALEYSLLKNNSPLTDWKINDFDNNLIWLKNLSPGDYVLKIRYAKQRHNVTEYHFKIKPYWYQTGLFQILITLFIIFIIGFFTLLYNLTRQKRKLFEKEKQKEKSENEVKSIRAQLNPHFVFNALNSVQGLINKNETEKANKYLADFATLMRSTLASSNKNTYSMDEEIKMLGYYLQLEQLRFPFQFRIIVEETINPSTTEIPVLLLQPLVENAVKHGVSSLQEHGKIEINFSRQEKNLIVKINDNGKGFNKTKEQDGYGLKLTNERIKLLNEMSKNQQINMQVQQNEETTIILTLENWLS